MCIFPPTSSNRNQAVFAVLIKPAAVVSFGNVIYPLTVADGAVIVPAAVKFPLLSSVSVFAEFAIFLQ
jgi:hypothetical protein